MAYKVIEIKESIYASNEIQAEALRRELKKKGVFLLNLMSSPGSGKTTTLCATLDALKDELRMGVIEADIDAEVDAAKVEGHAARTLQFHTGGMCHLDAAMTKQCVDELGVEGLDLVFLENVGNLVCPAEFDTGSTKNAMILSVPEGDDKPLKYPLMFSVCDVLLINKIDVLPYFRFDMEACAARARQVNPNIEIIPICAASGEGIDVWCDWLRRQLREFKER